VHETEVMLVRENVSSMVPAAPPDPDTPIRSWDGWQVEMETGPVVVVDALAWDVEVDVDDLAWDVDLDDLAGLVEQPASSKTTPTAAVIRRAARGRKRTACIVMRGRARVTRRLPVTR
jgi:hypothetical protein